MKARRVLRPVMFAALLLAASVLLIDTAFADVPGVDSVKPWIKASDNHVILNITITHHNYNTGHYVDWMQVDTDGNIDTVNLPQPQLTTFVAEYDMGVVSGNPTVRATAHCNLHGSGSWSSQVRVGGDDGNGGDGGAPVGGLINPNAPLTSDLTLLLQIVIFLVFLAGFILVKARRDFGKHGAIMGVAVALHTVSTLIVMVPSLLSGSGLFENLLDGLQLAILVHAALGVLVELLGSYVVLAWVFHHKDVKPCFRRKMTMRVLMVCWTIALMLGIYVYILLYTSL